MTEIDSPTAGSNDPIDVYPEPEVFSFPRRYDLSMLFVVSLAYAILFGFLRLLNAHASIVLIVGGFFATVAVAQAWLFGGEKPRLASIVSGEVFGFVVMIVVMILSPRFSVSEGVVFGIFCAVPLFALSGYCAGGIVGSLFMFAEYFRRAVRQFGHR